MREVVLRNKSSILCYHNPSAQRFRQHLKYLTKRYNIIPLETLTEAIKSKDWSAIPPKSLVITFDDGLKENYDLVAVLREFQIPVTLYLCSDIINTNRHYWFLTGVSNVQELKRRTTEERLAVLKQTVDYEPMKEYAHRQALNLQEIKEMTTHFNFGSHTRFHPILPKCGDAESLEEIKGSKESLEKILKRPVRHFSYPNGDFGDREIAYVKQSGYASAVTMKMGCNDINSNLLCLKRVGISDRASINELAAEMTWLLTCLRRFN